MQALTDSYTLQNGVAIPCIGFGTWQIENGEVAVQSVLEALRVGYRHIDTASVYENEESVGMAVERSEIAREDLFITSKLQNTVRGYNETKEAFYETLQKLRLTYLDLYLIHWPNPIHFRDNWKQMNAETWRAMEDLYKEGKIKAIGVSNFLPHHLEALYETAVIPPAVNQIRLCPGETQEETAKWCKAHNILLEAYSPLGNGRIFEVPAMQEFAKKYNKSIAQICIRWCLEMGYLPLPKSATPSRILENTQVFDFTLQADDVQRIAAMHACCGPTADPDTVPF